MSPFRLHETIHIGTQKMLNVHFPTFRISYFLPMQDNILFLI